MYTVFNVRIYLRVRTRGSSLDFTKTNQVFQADCAVYRSPLVPETKQRRNNIL